MCFRIYLKKNNTWVGKPSRKNLSVDSTTSLGPLQKEEKWHILILSSKSWDTLVSLEFQLQFFYLLYSRSCISHAHDSEGITFRLWVILLSSLRYYDMRETCCSETQVSYLQREYDGPSHSLTLSTPTTIIILVIDLWMHILLILPLWNTKTIILEVLWEIECLRWMSWSYFKISLIDSLPL